jgi:hypothetical protein
MDSLCKKYIDNLYGYGWSDYNEYPSEYNRLVSSLNDRVTNKNGILAFLYDTIPNIIEEAKTYKCTEFPNCNEYHFENQTEFAFMFTTNQNEFMCDWIKKDLKLNYNFNYSGFEFNIMPYLIDEDFDSDSEDYNEELKDLQDFMQINRVHNIDQIMEYIVYYGFSTQNGAKITKKRLYDLIHTLLLIDNQITVRISKEYCSKGRKFVGFDKIIKISK